MEVIQNGNTIENRSYIGNMEFLDNDISAAFHGEGRVSFSLGGDIVLSHPEVNTTAEYTGNTITSTQMITNSTVTYEASQEVVMGPEFEVSGSEWVARVVPAIPTDGRWEYKIRDHLGNTRVIFTDKNDDGNIKQSSDATNEVLSFYNYSPFGLEQGGSHLNVSGDQNRYTYNYKEKSSFSGYLNYGARFYDPSVGRWGQVDPMADLYSSYSPYNYVTNKPINAIDPDGQLIIFINGLNKSGSSSEDYWRKVRKNTGWVMTGSGFHRTYRTVDFASRVQSQLKDFSDPLFYDGSPRGVGENHNAGMRYWSGYNKGKQEAAKIIARLARDTDGNITESIKIITHSMGAVYGKGFVAALQQFIRNSDDPKINKARIGLIVDFDGFQNASEYGANVWGTKNQQFINSGFSSVLGWLANQQSENTEGFAGSEGSASHSLSLFLGDISRLEEGTYIWNSEKKKWDCTNCDNNK